VSGPVSVGPVGKLASKILGRQKEADRRISLTGYHAESPKEAATFVWQEGEKLRKTSIVDVYD
jgi:hypothetical protein